MSNDQNQSGKEWVSDFGEFLDASEITPPKSFSDQIFVRISLDLSPSLWAVLIKLSGLHAVIGGLSLLVCSQFGMGRTTALTHAFMRFGDISCMALCGALFVGATGIAAGLILSSSEIRALRRFVYAPIFILQVLSLGIFVLFGAEVAFAVGLAWLAGGLIAGIVFTELARSVRHAARA